MKVFWTALALLAALLVETGLSQVAPAYARIFDPFLIILVYCSLTWGETHGMLAGAAGGWVQDIHFGGTVLGLSGLAKVLVGFSVGLAATRFQLTEAAARALVLLAAAVLDALLFGGLAAAFDVSAASPGAGALALRAAVNAFLGVLFIETLERRVLRRRSGV